MFTIRERAKPFASPIRVASLAAVAPSTSETGGFAVTIERVLVVVILVLLILFLADRAL